MADTFQPLTKTQYDSARAAGFSAEQIIQNEKKRKSSFSSSPVTPEKPLANKVSDFFGGKGISDLIGASIAKATVPQEQKQDVNYPSTKEVVGSALQLGSLALPYGGIAKGISGAAKALPVLSKAAPVIGEIGAGALGGYGIDVGMNLQENKPLPEALTPGVGTALGAAIPGIGPLAKLGGRAIQEGVGITTGAGRGAVREAVENVRAGGDRSKAYYEQLRGNAPQDTIVSEARGALEDIISKRTEDYRKDLAKLKASSATYDTSPILEELQSQLRKFNVTIGRNADGTIGLDFGRSALRFNRGAQDDIRTIFEEMKKYGTQEGDRTVEGLDLLKRSFGDLYSDSSQARAFVAAMRDKVRGVLSKVEGYDKLAKEYESSTSLIKELRRGLSLGDKAQVDTTFKKLVSALKTNNEMRAALLKELNDRAGGTLISRIAGQQLSELAPRGLARIVTPGATGYGLFTGAISGIWPLLQIAALSSPRVVGELAGALGLGLRGADKLKQLLGVGKAGGLQFPGDIAAGTVAKKLPTKPSLGGASSVVSKSLGDKVNAVKSGLRTGYTTNIDGSEYAGRDAITTLRSQTLSAKEATPEKIKEFLDLQKELLEVSDDIKVGIYKMDNGGISVDINIATPNRTLAKQIAEINNQEAYYDAATNSVVNTGGSGVSSVPTEEAISILRSAKYFNPDDAAVGKVAESFMKSKGIKAEDPRLVFTVDRPRAMRIADAFDAMKDAPNDPAVKKAYEALATETKEQYDALIKAGYKIEPWLEKGQPYANSVEMAKDVRDNKHLFFFLTDEGFGTGVSNSHPLLKDSGVSINGKKLKYNDLFRAVHDFFGHAKLGNQFGSLGEENAWRTHSKMFSPEARKAMTTETRGQNSWVNFGPQMRGKDGKLLRKGEKGYLAPSERKYAEQKTGLLPEEFWEP